MIPATWYVLYQYAITYTYVTELWAPVIAHIYSSGGRGGGGVVPPTMVREVTHSHTYKYPLRHIEREQHPTDRNDTHHSTTLPV